MTLSDSKPPPVPSSKRSWKNDPPSNLC